MNLSSVQVDVSDWAVIRGSVAVNASRDTVEAVVRQTVGLLGRFTIAELNEAGGVLAIRTTLLARAETIHLKFRSVNEVTSVVEASSKAANRLGFGPGLERRTQNLRILLDSLAQRSTPI